MPEPKPNIRCTGIFIPIEILDLTDSKGEQILTLTEKVLLSIIDSYYCEKHGGCFASNEYLANKLDVKENTIVKALIKFRKLGMIEDVSFNGRIRVIRSLVGEFICKKQRKKPEKKPISSPKSESYPAYDSASESQAECDLNHRQSVTKITGRPGLKSHPIYEDIKAYRKEEPLSQTLSQTTDSCRSPFSPKGRKGKEGEGREEGAFFKCLEGIAVSDSDKRRLCSEYPEVTVAQAVAYSKTVKGKPRTTLDRALFYYCSNPKVMNSNEIEEAPEVKHNKENIVNTNRDWANELYERILNQDPESFDLISVTSDGVWFTFPRAHGRTEKDFITYTAAGFRERVESNSRKLNIW